MSGPYDTGRFAETDDPVAVEDRAGLVRLIEQMSADLAEHPDAWENHTLPRYLDVLGRLLDDRYDLRTDFADASEDAGPNLTWQQLAVLILVATGYE